MKYSCKGKSTAQVISDLQVMRQDEALTLISWNGNKSTKLVSEHLTNMKHVLVEEKLMFGH
jgi:hypothetical protein